MRKPAGMSGKRSEEDSLMKQDYTQQVEAVIRFLGGAGNILSVTNCMTRLRVVVKDAAAVDEEKLRAQEDVMGVLHDRERYIEIVVGIFLILFGTNFNLYYLVLAGRAQKIPYEQFEEDLLEIEERAKEVPGGACGFYGNCGAAVGIGLFLSVYTGTDPHSEEYWGECNLATGRALQSIGEIAGPRCCKRNSFLALCSALDTLEEFLHISIPRTGEIRCKYHDANPDCKGSECPFFHKEAES